MVETLKIGGNIKMGTSKHLRMLFQNHFIIQTNVPKHLQVPL